jgi:hypothetical protein
MSIIDLATYRALTNTNASDGLDAYITTLLPVVTSEICSYCDRTFENSRYYKWFNYSGDRLVVLPEFPVNEIIYIGFPAKVATVSYPAGNYNIEITKTGVTVTNDATFAQNTYTFAVNTILSDLKTVIEAAYPAITLTIESGYDTMNSLLLRTGSGLEWTGAVRLDTNVRLQDRSDRVVEVSYNTPFIMSYQNDYVYSDELLVVWNAGYTAGNYPKDLQMVEAMIIKDYLALSKLKSGGILKSETITNYQYVLADQTMLADLVKKYSGILDGYVKKIL